MDQPLRMNAQHASLPAEVNPDPLLTGFGVYEVPSLDLKLLQKVGILVVPAFYEEHPSIFVDRLGGGLSLVDPNAQRGHAFQPGDALIEPSDQLAVAYLRSGSPRYR